MIIRIKIGNYYLYFFLVQSFFAVLIAEIFKDLENQELNKTKRCHLKGYS